MIRVAVDLECGTRCKIPGELASRFGDHDDRLVAVEAAAGWRAVTDDLIGRIEELEG